MGLTFELITMGHAALAARSWRTQGRHLLTVIVKGTFTLVHDAAMTVAPPAPIGVEERHFRNSPVASLVRGSDLALHLPKAEVVVVGSAFAPRGQTTKATSVRLVVQSERATLVDKRIEVIGDRRALAGAPPPEPTPFDRMPLHYERAFGGMASRENPVGRGSAPDDDGRISYPNLFVAEGKGVTPAGFGPIPSVWPARSMLRGSLGLHAANVASDVDLPADFNEHYFQTAPVDQRMAELTGTELVTLVHMHPDFATLRTYLPRARGVAMVQTARGERLPVGLRIDTVHLEPDAMRAEIVYRGVLTLKPDQLSHLAIAGALETPEQPFVFPDLASLRGASPAAVAPPSTSHAGTMVLEPTPAAPKLGGTMLLEPEPAPAAAATPFSKQALLQAARARNVPPAPPPPTPAQGHTGTMILEPPAAHAAPAESAEAANPKSTVLLLEEPSTEGPKSLPFAKGRRKRSGELPAVIAAKSATPWADRGKPEPVAPASGGKFSSTMFVEEPVVATPAPPAIPKAAPEASAPVETPPAPPRDPSKGVWREEPNAEPAPVPKAKPVVPPRTDVKGALYKTKR